MTGVLLYVPEIGPDADTITAALAWAAAGVYVLPVRQATKHPGSVVGKHWQAKSSRDPQQIAAWFAGTDYALALHVGRSGLVVFDVDKPAKLPTVLSDAFDSAAPPYQSTREDVPGRGHYVFAQPPGPLLGNSTGKLGDAWGEIRGRNGIIVVAPSEHAAAAAGGRYRWERTGPVPVLPESVAELLPDALDAADAATDAVVRAFLAEHTGNSRPDLLAALVRRFGALLANGGSRHDAALLKTLDAMREAAAGWYPAREAAARLAVVFVAVMARPRKPGDRLLGESQARAEYAGILAWAVAQATTRKASR
jgi:hypothetical protein